MLTTAAVVWFAAVYRRTISAVGLGTFLLGTGCLVAFTVARWNPAEWSGFHALMSAAAVTAWLMCLSRSLPSLVERRALGPISDLLERTGKPQFADSWPRHTGLFATIVGILTVLLALRSALQDPVGAWWSVGTLLAMSALAAALNWQTLGRVYIYAAGILFNLSVSIWYLSLAWQQRFFVEFFQVNLIALSLATIVWLALEIRARRSAGVESKWSFALAYHNPAALLSLFLVALITLENLFKEGVPYSHRLDWPTFVSVMLLMFACLWDKHAKYSVAGLYLLGLIAAGMALQDLNLSHGHLGWALMCVAATYTVLSSAFWRERRRLMAWASQLKIPLRVPPGVTELRWLQVFNALLIAFVCMLAYWIDIRFTEWTLRITAALAVAAQALTFALLAPTEGKRGWQRAAFAMFVLGAVFFGWAWLVPGVTGTWLNRAVILMVEMFAIVALFGLELDKLLAREPEWARAIRACVPWITGVGIIALIFVLCTEVFYQIEFGAVRVKPLALVTIGLTLAGASVICILFALSPKHDPLSLPEERRRNYVYVAELMLALFFMHIRLTMPWLFTGFFERYWPVVVVAIAYVGVAASELLRRRRVLVLAHPIERTGVFLPLLPVLGFWLTKPEVDYSVLLFIVGGLYGLVSILRRSFVFGILAVLAGNGGLWYLWHRTGDYGFLQHPQLWLIPVAGSVLIAAYLNREDFSEEQMIGIRYLALITIYASSTADIFINGVARSPWLPLILAALSLAGVFGGIMLRIRAFLLLGSVFLLLAITTMIYYASANFGWTWLWYVAGIVTGAMIIFTFALFEKKRDEMLRVVEGLREWER